MATSDELRHRRPRFGVPSVAFHSPQLRLLRQIAVVVPFICNDVFSFEKETARGDVYNLVTVLCNERGISVEEAVEEVQRMVRRQLDSFLERRQQVPQVMSELAPNETQREHVRQYVTGLGDWLRGHNDWMTATVRYTADRTPPAHQPGYLDELLLAP